MDEIQGLLEASPDAVLVVDSEGVVQLGNRNVPAVLGFSSREVEGKTVEELLREEDREEHVGLRQEYMTDPEPRPMGRDLDLYALRKDGTSVPVEISLGPIERDGELYVVATIADVSERKRREQELQRQNERLNEFASIVSHDLQGPLSVISGRLHLLRHDCDSEQIDAIADAVDRMDALIGDLLRLARAGELVEDIEPVDLPVLVEECWAHVESADATLAVTAECTIRADRGRLQQLLENLLNNAVEHGETAVTVVVGELDDGFVVEDDGPGVPPDSREHVFRRGYTTSADGTGFGLAIVEEIVEAHGWQIRVTEGESSGARFEITGVEFVHS